MRNKRETLDKKDDNLKIRKIAKKQKMLERGITLIALVVTIIILLILAGVTLNIALSDNGLFSKAKKAAEEYKEAQSQEEDLISQFAKQMYSEYVGAKVSGYELPERISCNVETKINNDSTTIFERDNKTNWRVWDYDGTTLRIIADSTTAKLKLNGAAGYNNGILAMDEICKKLYSNGKTGVTATNLKRTDIQKVSTYDYTKYKHELSGWEEVLGTDTENTIQFGESMTYKNGNTKYPSIWNENDKNWAYEYSDKNGASGRDKECTTWEKNNKETIDNNMITGDASTIFKESYYAHKYEKDEFISNSYYDLIFKKSDGTISNAYWLAGRYAHIYTDYCLFGVQRVSVGENENGQVDGLNFCYSNRCRRRQRQFT